MNATGLSKEAILSLRKSSNANGQRQRKAQADARNAELEATFASLHNILKNSLARDTYIDLEELKTTPHIELFEKRSPGEAIICPQRLPA